MAFPLQMTQQQLEDEAAVYCREAVAYIRSGNWEGATRILVTALKVTDMALQSATPGGSEYVANVDRCAEHIRELKADAIKWRLSEARKQKTKP